MKTFATLTALLALAFSGLAQQDMPPFDKDIGLSEGVRLANKHFPNLQPLTDQEVIAAVKAIKLTHPDIKEEVYDQYIRVVRDHVLPKGMSFRRTSSWSTSQGRFEVDWLDLCLEGRLANAEERTKILSKVPSDFKITGEIHVDGFSYRLRAKFVSPIPAETEVTTK
jgi:hypothetical protein